MSNVLLLQRWGLQIQDQRSSLLYRSLSLLPQKLLPKCCESCPHSSLFSALTNRCISSFSFWTCTCCDKMFASRWKKDWPLLLQNLAVKVKFFHQPFHRHSKPRWFCRGSLVAESSVGLLWVQELTLKQGVRSHPCLKSASACCTQGLMRLTGCINARWARHCSDVAS